MIARSIRSPIPIIIYIENIVRTRTRSYIFKIPIRTSISSFGVFENIAKRNIYFITSAGIISTVGKYYTRISACLRWCVVITNGLNISAVTIFTSFRVQRKRRTTAKQHTVDTSTKRNSSIYNAFVIDIFFGIVILSPNISDTHKRSPPYSAL